MARSSTTGTLTVATDAAGFAGAGFTVAGFATADFAGVAFACGFAGGVFGIAGLVFAVTAGTGGFATLLLAGSVLRAEDGVAAAAFDGLMVFVEPFTPRGIGVSNL